MKLAMAGALLVAVAPCAAVAQTPPTAVPTLLGTGLKVSDADRSLKFYRDGLGMVVATKLDFPELTEVMLSFQTQRAQQATSAGLILMIVKGPAAEQAGAPAPAFGKIVLRMPDIVAIAARLKAAGFNPGAIGGSTAYKTLNVKDPDGYHIEIVQTGAAH